MRRFMVMLLALAVMAAVAAPLPADGPAMVKPTFCTITASGQKYAIDSTHTLPKAVGSAATNTDRIDLTYSELHSVGVAVITTKSQTLTITPQASWDGTHFFQPTGVSASSIPVVTGTAAAPCYAGGGLALDCYPYYRLVIAAPPTYPVTFVAVVVPGF